jgi:hypothetical protein
MLLASSSPIASVIAATMLTTSSCSELYSTNRYGLHPRLNHRKATWTSTNCSFSLSKLQTMKKSKRVWWELPELLTVLSDPWVNPWLQSPGERGGATPAELWPRPKPRDGSDEGRPWRQGEYVKPWSPSDLLPEISLRSPPWDLPPTDVAPSCSFSSSWGWERWNRGHTTSGWRRPRRRRASG